MSCCPTVHNQNTSCSPSMSFCCQDSPRSCCNPPSVVCRPVYPMKTPLCPIKTIVYLRPKGGLPPCCPMPCPPKVLVTTYPSCEPPPPPPPKKCFLYTVKRIPVMPPPPPTPPMYSPCRPHVVPCLTN